MDNDESHLRRQQAMEEARQMLRVRSVEEMEGFFDLLRPTEIYFIRCCCALQRSYNEYRAKYCRRMEFFDDLVRRLYVQVDRRRVLRRLGRISRCRSAARKAWRHATTAFDRLRQATEYLLIASEVREEVQKWIDGKYQEKVKEGMKLNKDEEARSRRFTTAIEYSVDYERTVDCFELYNLDFDERSRIRAAVNSAVSLFPDEH